MYKASDGALMVAVLVRGLQNIYPIGCPTSKNCYIGSWG